MVGRLQVGRSSRRLGRGGPILGSRRAGGLGSRAATTSHEAAARKPADAQRRPSRASDRRRGGRAREVAVGVGSRAWPAGSGGNGSISPAAHQRQRRRRRRRGPSESSLGSSPRVDAASARSVETRVVDRLGRSSWRPRSSPPVAGSGRRGRQELAEPDQAAAGVGLDRARAAGRWRRAICVVGQAVADRAGSGPGAGRRPGRPGPRRPGRPRRPVRPARRAGRRRGEAVGQGAGARARAGACGGGRSGVGGRSWPRRWSPTPPPGRTGRRGSTGRGRSPARRPRRRPRPRRTPGQRPDQAAVAGDALAATAAAVPLGRSVRGWMPARGQAAGGGIRPAGPVSASADGDHSGRIRTVSIAWMIPLSRLDVGRQRPWPR